MNRYFFQQSVSILLVLALLLPNLALAQTGTTATQKAEQDLQAQRREYERQCQKELGIDSLADKAGTISNIVSQGLTRQIPNTLSSFMSERLPDLLGKQLQKTLPQLVQNELNKNLLSRVNNSLRGMSNEEARSALPGILKSQIQNILAQTLQNQLPVILDDTLNQNLPDHIAQDFRTAIPDILNASDLKSRIGQSTSQMFQSLLSALQDPDLLTSIFGGGASFSPQTMLSMLPTLISAVSQLKNSTASQGQIEDGMMSGISNVAGEGAANSAGIQQLSDQLVPLISQYLLPQLLAHFNQSFSGGLAESGGSFGGGYNSALGNLTGSNYDLSGGLSGQVLNPVVDGLRAPMSNWIASGVQNLATGLKFDTPLVQVQIEAPDGTLYAAPGDTSGQMQTINGELVVVPAGSAGWSDNAGQFSPAGSGSDIDTATGVANVGGEFVTAAPGDSIQMIGGEAVAIPTDWSEGAMSSIADTSVDAGELVSANSTGIAQGIFSGDYFKGMGQNIASGLTGGLVDGVSGMVGDLVGDVPVVGGLLAGITEQMTSQVMMSLLGVVPGIGTFLVVDQQNQGTQQNLSAGFKGVAKIEGKIQGNTKTSNQNEKQNNKQNDKMISLQMEVCLREKMTQGATYDLQEKERVDDPAAREQARLTLQDMWNSTKKSFGQIYQVSQGTIGATGATPANSDNPNNGQSVVAQLDQNIANGQAEVANKNQALAKTSNSGNIHGDDISKAMQKIDKTSVIPKSIMTRDQFDSANDPAKIQNTDPKQLFDNSIDALTDNFDTGFLAADYKTAKDKDTAKELAQAQYTAGGGYNDTRKCDDPGHSTPSPGSTSTGEANAADYDAATGTWCWHWTTVTPGSTNKSWMEALLLSVIHLLENAHTVQEDAAKQDAASRLTDVQNLVAAKQQTTTTDPCPGTGPCPDNQQSIVSGLDRAVSSGLNQLSNLNVGGGSGNGNSTGSGNSNPFANLDLGQLLGNLQPVTPVISYFRLSADKTKLEWATQDSGYCVAPTDWPNTNPEVKAGDEISANGEAPLDLASLTQDQNYQISCYGFLTAPVAQEVVVSPNPAP